MSNSETPRLIRGPAPKRTFNNRTYRKAIDALLRDSEGRCAYSMQHLKRAGGKRCMEVDHFRPRGAHRNQFKNLLPATRHCNGAKGQTWPTKGQERNGIRLLNPFNETDYGKHIFEDPISHELIGSTPAGRYQIIICDLNAPHLVEERKDRTRIRQLLQSPGTVKAGLSDAKNAISELRREVEQMIPPIAAPRL